MKINILLHILLKTTMVIIILIINSMKFSHTQSWQNTLRLAKRHTHHDDIDILKTALDNFVYKMDNRKYIQRPSHLVNITNNYEKNITHFNNQLDNNNELILANYSSDTNALIDDIQENNLKNYFIDQTVKNLKNTNSKNNLFTQVHSSSNTSFTWNILQFSFGLLCFIIHVTWFIWLICHTVLFKICQQSISSQFETVSHSNKNKISENDLLIKHNQLTMHSELHLGFIGTIYGFIISIRQLSSPFVDPKSTTSLDQTSLVNRNYLLCYFTRHILLGLLTVYWITIFIIILINTHYIKSIYVMNTSKIPLINNVFVILYISFIVSWIFSIVIRIGSLLINYNLQKFKIKHLFNTNYIPIQQVLHFECINIKNIEHQKMYFYIVCNQTTLEQWLEIITNILSDILPNFLVFSISIFNCSILFKLRNHSYKYIHSIKQIIKFSNNSNNNNNDINNNENIIKLNNLSNSKDKRKISKICKTLTSTPLTSTPSSTLTSSCLMYQCDIPIQYKKQNNQLNNDNILNKQTIQFNILYKINQIIYFSISLIIISFCLLINHLLRLIIYGNLMKTQMNYCNLWNFNQDLNEPENIKLFKYIYENLHIPHQYLQGCILMEIFIITFIPIICFIIRRCKYLFYKLCFKLYKINNLKQIINNDLYKKRSECLYDKSIKMDYIDLSKLTIPISSPITLNTNDDIGNQSTITTSLSSTTQCCQLSMDTIIPPCELLKLQTFTRAQFEQKPQLLIDKETHLKSINANMPTCSNEVSEQQTITTTTFVPVSIKLVNLQPLCCQSCDIFTGGTKILSKPDDTVIECEYLNNSCIYPIETTGSVVKLHVVSDSSGYDE
ncbi:unnamed protein product [Schistosoma spindalis]|nr:unnamed protein product [Schistosoma spindale]